MKRVLKIAGICVVILGLWPGLVIVDTDTEQLMSRALSGPAKVAAALSSHETVPDKKSLLALIPPNHRVVLRIGFPLRPMICADWSRSTKTAHEINTSWALFGDSLGMFYSVVLVLVGGLTIWRQKNEHGR
jgi:hypothetical protein